MRSAGRAKTAMLNCNLFEPDGNLHGYNEFAKRLKFVNVECRQNGAARDLRYNDQRKDMKPNDRTSTSVAPQLGQNELRLFGLDTTDVLLQPLGNHGGMSGAWLWRVQRGDETFCLRRWPDPGPSASRMSWIHQLQLTAVAAGCNFVPQPIAPPGLEAGPKVPALGTGWESAAQTWARHAGRLWELTRWVPGTANFHERPTDTRLRAAASAVAMFHRAVAHLPVEPSGNPQHSELKVSNPGLPRAVAPSVEMRVRLLQQLTNQECVRFAQAIDGRYGDGVAEASRSVMTHLLARRDQDLARLREIGARPVPVQPCIGDVWHDHLLFEGDRVTGLVDYGAARVDTVLADLARMLGSLVPDQPARWEIALDAYRQAAPLEPESLPLLAVLDRVNPLMAGVNWVRWLFVEGRRFHDVEGLVAGRLDQVVARLRFQGAGT